MKTLLIQVNDDKAFKLLENLEDLQLIKVLKKNVQAEQKLSEKYRGVFSKEDAKDFNEHTQTMRKEWNSI